jgi:uncharacterized membrane protein
LDVVVVVKLVVKVDRADETVVVIDGEDFAVDGVDVVIGSANVVAGLSTGTTANVVGDLAAVAFKDCDEVIANTVEAAVEIVAAITDGLVEVVEVADAAEATVTAEPALMVVVVLVVVVVAVVAAVAVKEEVAALRRNWFIWMPGLIAKTIPCLQCEKSSVCPQKYHWGSAVFTVKATVMSEVSAALYWLKPVSNP